MYSGKGFTLIELLVALLILAILVSIGLPSFRNLILDNRLTSSTNTLVGALQMARSEAVTLRDAITICPTNAGGTACNASTNWSSGTLMVRGATVLRAIPSNNTGVIVTSSRNAIIYNANGTATSATISVSDTRPSSKQIKVNTLGQACSGSGCS